MKIKGNYRFLAITFFLFSAFTIQAQEDSLKQMTIGRFLDLVKANHPLAIQADLQPEIGNRTVQKARGAFDPKAAADLSQKYFDGKQYYDLQDGGLKIPTWFGMELGAGYMENGGVFLNPENNTPGAGLWQAGITLPIGQGLFIDERRAELRKAQIFEESSLLEQRLMYNKLLYKAGQTYWEWFTAYNNLRVFQNAVQLAEFRFNAVKQGAAVGDRPDIDTLEAGIQLQNRMLNLQQSQVDYRNARLKMSIFLWSEGVIPLELEDNTVPPISNTMDALPLDNSWIARFDEFMSAHPLINTYRFKLDMLGIEQRWKREQLKPDLNLKYNALNEPVGDDIIADYSINNYTWGIQFVMPLFLRKERASLRLNELKIRDTQLDLTDKQASLAFKARAVLNEWETLEGLVELYQQTVQDYLGLLNGERQMFNAGESSLFMVNSRELGYINAQLKLIELLAKNHKAELKTLYSFGVLGDE